MIDNLMFKKDIAEEFFAVSSNTEAFTQQTSDEFVLQALQRTNVVLGEIDNSFSVHVFEKLTRIHEILNIFWKGPPPPDPTPGMA